MQSLSFVKSLLCVALESEAWSHTFDQGLFGYLSSWGLGVYSGSVEGSSCVLEIGGRDCVCASRNCALCSPWS